MHSRKYRNAAATCDVVFVNSAFTGRDVTATLGVPPERIRVAHPAPKPVFRPTGPEPTSARRTSSPSRRSSRARTCRCSSRRSVCSATTSARGRRRGGLGRAAAPRRAADPATRLRLGRGARASLPRRRGGRVSVALRGLRDPRDRGDGVRRAGRRLRHESLDEASGDAALRADPEDPAAFAPAIEARLRPGAARRARPRARRGVLLARGRRDLPPRLRGGGVRERGPGDRRRRAAGRRAPRHAPRARAARLLEPRRRRASSRTRRRGRPPSASCARRPVSRRRCGSSRSRCRTRCSTIRRRSGPATRPGIERVTVHAFVATRRWLGADARRRARRLPLVRPRRGGRL